MPYLALTYKVMIASPSDVETERDIVREVVHEWNVMHSEKEGIVLMPVGWDTHAAPAFGASAQQVINRQVLAGCDLLVANFWTRFGTPTGTSPSGTAEEIAAHQKAGGHVMLYFSTAAAPPDRVAGSKDAVRQYAALKEFRASCQQSGSATAGLYHTYSTAEQFREDFRRHLAMTVNAHFSGPARQAPPRPVELSETAARLLLAATEPGARGGITWSNTFDGTQVTAGVQRYDAEDDSLEESELSEAIEQLAALGLTKLRSTPDPHFRNYGITAAGRQLAAELRESRPPELGGDAAMVLRLAKEHEGHIFHTRRLTGRFAFTIGDRHFGPHGEPEEMARWKAVLAELIDSGHVEDESGKGQLFRVTERGYQWLKAHSVPEQQPSAPPPPSE